MLPNGTVPIAGSNSPRASAEADEDASRRSALAKVGAAPDSEFVSPAGGGGLRVLRALEGVTASHNAQDFAVPPGQSMWSVKGDKVKLSAAARGGAALTAAELGARAYSSSALRLGARNGQLPSVVFRAPNGAAFFTVGDVLECVQRSFALLGVDSTKPRLEGVGAFPSGAGGAGGAGKAGGGGGGSPAWEQQARAAADNRISGDKTEELLGAGDGLTKAERATLPVFGPLLVS